MNNKAFEEGLQSLTKQHEKLISKPNKKIEPGNGIYDRYENPVLTAAHAPLFGGMT